MNGRNILLTGGTNASDPPPPRRKKLRGVTVEGEVSLGETEKTRFLEFKKRDFTGVCDV